MQGAQAQVCSQSWRLSLPLISSHGGFVCICSFVGYVLRVQRETNHRTQAVKALVKIPGAKASEVMCKVL